MIPTIVTSPLPHGQEHGRPIKQLVVHAAAEIVRNDDPAQGPVGDIPVLEFHAATEKSAHAYITPAGVLHHCVSRDRVAWHAKGFNTGRLGVELLVAGVHGYNSFLVAIGWDRLKWSPKVPRPADPFTPEQYETLGWWLAREARFADLGWAAVTTHHLLTPAVKADPGPVFNWQLTRDIFTRELAAEAAA